MPGGQGYRARTRYTFQRAYRKAGYIPLSTYLTNYKLGDYVDIHVNGAVHKVRRGRRDGAPARQPADGHGLRAPPERSARDALRAITR